MTNIILKLKKESLKTKLNGEPDDGEKNRTNTMIRKLNIMTSKDLTLISNRSVVKLLADNFENIFENCQEAIKTNPLYFVSLDEHSWDAGMKYTNTELGDIQEADLFLIFEKVTRRRISDCMGKRYVVSVNDT